MKDLDGNRVDVEKHIELNERTSKAIPTIIPSWLESARNITQKVETLPTDVGGCFNVKQRYTVGKESWKNIEEIDRLLETHSKTKWTELPIPLGKVQSPKASTSILYGGFFRGYESRMSIFSDVLEVLTKDDEFRVVGLWGIGGVGKTTMLKQIKKTAVEGHLFGWVVSATVGQEPNLNQIQEAIALDLGLTLQGDDAEKRADQLRRGFDAILQKSSKKILVTLDDLWTPLNLESICLTPLASENKRMKILMTSRNEAVCKSMGLGDTCAVFQIQVMPRREAWMLLTRMTNISLDTDHELYQISNEIVKECDCLPLAIEAISKNLRNSRKYTWHDVPRRLKNSQLKEPVFRVLQVSFGFLESDDTRGVFLLCCLHQEDAHILIEDLVRYVVGLKTFERMDGMDMEDIRNHVRTCVEELKSASFLLYNEPSESVTMHDLVREFGQNVAPYSKDNYVASMVNHAGIHEWPWKESYESFASISLDCSNMISLPNALTCPNLFYLMLACRPRRNNPLKFPEDFYKGMDKLKFVTYKGMDYPLLPTSFPLCSNIQALCLNSCKLTDDLSVIGNLGSLEILSFVECGIRRLPSSIGRLKKLKILDVSGCQNLVIEDGALGGLSRLEELYMKGNSGGAAINFTASNFQELETLCQTLSSFEIEFFLHHAQPKPVLFKNLKRFRISVGHSLYMTRELFRNTLNLQTEKSKVLSCGINGLFHVTEILRLQVEGIHHVGEISAVNDFLNLKVLEVENCWELVHIVDAAGGKACNISPVQRPCV